MDYESLIRFHIRKILMVCSNYDAFILKEDGQIESEIRREYIELGLTTPPRFVWVTTAEEAYITLGKDDEIDMVICMYNASDNAVFGLARKLKDEGSTTPFILLTNFSHGINKMLSGQDMSAIDYAFTWHGNADLILAIVKLFEDRENAEHDMLQVGVQGILLVEDSVRYYSTYLPELYKLVLTQSAEFFKESLNGQQFRERKRSRPKILLATNYEQALDIFNRYRKNLLGVITDMGFAMRKGEKEVLDAGLQFISHIKTDEPQMPVLLQSAQASGEKAAAELGAGFLKKYSKTLTIQLSEYIRNEFCFGDFVFRDKERNEYGRAGSLREFEPILKTIPDDVFIYNTSRNMLSKWFYARGLFALATSIRKISRKDFSDITEHRAYLVRKIHEHLSASGSGVIANFNSEAYARYIWFARMGEGSLGGKARGLAFLNSLIQKYDLTSKYEGVKVSIPRSIVIATDYFEQFIIENGLQYVIESEISDEEVLSEFVSSSLPEKLRDQLLAYVNTVRTPLAIRSSSKLEDSNYQPFAGVYSTYMIPYVENKGQMMRMLGNAIKSVYASVYFASSRNYIQSTGNLISEEKMGVIVQSICGSEHDGMYFPMLSGVARSVNFYPIGSETSDEGVVNLAFGLGKTVVDGGSTLRFNPAHPKKVLQLSEPKLALRDSQKELYALDMRPVAFKLSTNDGANLNHVKVSDILNDYPFSKDVASTLLEDSGRMTPGINGNGPKIITFDSILKYRAFPLSTIMQDIMRICRQELMSEVEIEFAVDPREDGIYNFKLLQVRPISQVAGASSEEVQKAIGEMKHILVKCDRALGVGITPDITHAVYVSPEAFDSSKTREAAEQISKFNKQMQAEGKTFALIGPGRWGSSDPWLGIPVEWGSISEVKTIVEYSMPGFMVEPSQGTHFFQNLTSLGVGYMTVDTSLDPDAIDFRALDSMECIADTGLVRLIKFNEPVTACLDRSDNSGVIGY